MLLFGLTNQLLRQDFGKEDTIMALKTAGLCMKIMKILGCMPDVLRDSLQGELILPAGTLRITGKLRQKLVREIHGSMMSLFDCP